LPDATQICVPSSAHETQSQSQLDKEIELKFVLESDSESEAASESKSEEGKPMPSGWTGFVIRHLKTMR